MSKVKHYTPDRLVLHGLAADHLRANHGTSHQQLMQLFALTGLEARDVQRAVEGGHAASGAIMKAAMAWAIENMAGNTQIADRFGISEGNARRVALSAKRVNAKKIAAAKAKLDVAVQYAADHPFESAKSIAMKFSVSPHSIERLRRVRRNATAAVDKGKQEAPKPPRKQRRLFAVMADGSTVHPHKLRNVNDAIGFTEVLV